MSTTVTSSFQIVMKNFMLDQWRNQGTLTLSARDGIVVFASATVTFAAASNGKVALASNVNLTVPSDDTWTLTNFVLQIGFTTQTQYTLPLAQQGTFTDGGTIVVTLLDVEILD